MNLFNIFRKRRQSESPDPSEQENPVPRDLFVDESDPVQVSGPGTVGATNGIEGVYAYLQEDYESRGYSDAMTNPDASYKSDNLRLLKQDLLIHIQRASTYYESILKELDFHINSRSRAGLVDLVEEMEMRKELVLNHLKKIDLIRHDVENQNGMTERISLSYQRGFARGLAAISQASVLNIKL
jgi:hypothetical protein